jgi:flagellin-like hook-associated protein FlgL
MNDEFDAMRSEIDRIAKATDFNGIKMLDTGSTGVKEVLTAAGDANNFASTGEVKDAFTGFASGETIVIHWTAKDGTEGYDSFVMTNSAETIASLLTSITGAGSFDGTAAWTSGAGMSITGDAAGNSLLDIELTDGTSTYQFTTATEGKDGQVKVHFGTGNDSAEDYYNVDNQNMTKSGLGISALSITTAASAAAALATIDTAIIQKDTARAHFGAMMNRLENTVSNLTIQSENIQAAESQISDVDVAFEMTNFMNTQIKAQAAVSMLAQANSMPQMAMSLLG